MNLDARIVAIVRRGPGAVPLRHLCLLMFPTFAWDEMQCGIACVVRRRCEELAREGRLLEIAENLFLMAPGAGMCARRTARA